MSYWDLVVLSGRYYILAHNMVHLGVRKDGRVLMVLTVKRVFLQRCKDFLCKIYE